MNSDTTVGLISLGGCCSRARLWYIVVHVKHALVIVKLPEVCIVVI